MQKVKMILVLTGSYQSNNVEIEKYLKETFDPFKPIWIDSIDKRIKEFNEQYQEKFFHFLKKRQKLFCKFYFVLFYVLSFYLYLRMK